MLYYMFESYIESYNITGWATSTTAQSSTADPAEIEAIKCLEEGTHKLEDGDVQGAKVRYAHSSNQMPESSDSRSHRPRINEA